MSDHQEKLELSSLIASDSALSLLDGACLYNDTSRLITVRDSYAACAADGPPSPETCKVWLEMKEEASRIASREPLMGSYLFATILNHKTMSKALSSSLAAKLGGSDGMTEMLWSEVINEVFDGHDEDWSIRMAMREDLIAIKAKDCACTSLLDAFLYYKGFLGLQSYRIANSLWKQQRYELARLLQSRVSTVFSMDIHPAATLGSGLLFDHASGVVVGETAVVGNGCSFLHNVTLGGTGKNGGDRHPKLGSNVSVGAGVSILGNIKIGSGAKVGAGSVVLKEVPEEATVVGIPARVIVRA